MFLVLFFFQAEDGIRDWSVTGVQTCALPISRPIARADMGPTNPEAGVIATRPATDPEIAPSTLGFPLRTHSAPAQPRAAAAAPKCVATKALVASAPAERALPALKPNHPTQSRQAPTKLSTTLCGGIGCFGNPRRLPRYSAQMRAEIPDVMCTTVPPAKSSVGTAPPSEAFSRPPLPHTIWAMGA